MTRAPQAPQSSITRASQVVRQSTRTGAGSAVASTSASASVSTVRQCGGRRRSCSATRASHSASPEPGGAPVAT